MKIKTFEEFLSDRCPCHTNNGPEGFEKWLENLDTQEVMDYAESYGKIQYLDGMQTVLDEFAPHITKLKELKDTLYA